MKNVIKYCGRYHCAASIRCTILCLEAAPKPTHSKTKEGLLVNLVGNFLGDRRKVETK